MTFRQNSKTFLMGFLLVLLAPSSWVGAQTTAELPAVESLRGLPVQSGGRLKPLDTLARESVRLVTGKASFQGRDPVVTLLSWWADPDLTRTVQCVEFRDLEVKRALGLEVDRRWFTLVELQSNKVLIEKRELIHQRLRNDEELRGSDVKIQELLSKIQTLAAVADGSVLRGVPNPQGLDQPWASFADLERADVVEQAAGAKRALGSLRAALREAKVQEAATAAGVLRSQLETLGPVPTKVSMQREVGYNASHPFRKAWVLYLAGFLALVFVKPGAGAPKGYWVGAGLIAVGFGFHVYGFLLRCLIAGRPPVTNMYESVIWVAFGAVLFAFLLEFRTLKGEYLKAAAAGATVCLILADLLPTVLDPSIHPLTPVLRSNFWLTIHVLCITLGYAAFLLSLGLGHMVLWKSALRKDSTEQLNSLHEAVYRAIQIGVLFLAAGTILGGVWANYSWGRFWGWDPKEVWALIALLGYLAILHGRYAGWLRNFGVSAWSVLAFQGVLMAWYGVNYVLGAGLHSYGFGSGGGRYVAVFSFFEVAFVLWAWWRHRNAPVLTDSEAPKGPVGCPFSAFSKLESKPQGENNK